MTTPDILETVGFQKGKFGHGDKELGYTIAKKQLGKITLLALTAAAGVVVTILWYTMFEIRIERRHAHHELRTEEHHLTSKLAEAEMKLWSHYHDDIHESHEATQLLQHLNASYDVLRDKLKHVIDEEAKSPHAHLIDQIMDVIADHRHQNVWETKKLVDHLVALGKHSARMEKRVDEKMTQDMKSEKAQLDEEEDERDDNGEDAIRDRGENEDDEVKKTLAAFWKIYNAFHKRFRTAVNSLQEDSPVYKQLKDLQGKLQVEEGSADQMSDEDIKAALGAMDSDLRSVGVDWEKMTAEYDSLDDFVESLLAIPKLPRMELTGLEEDFREGTKDCFTILLALHDWEEAGRIPAIWLQQASEPEVLDTPEAEASEES